MRVADDFQQVCPGLYFWEVYEPAVKAELSCAGLQTKEGLVLVDPVPLRNLEDLIAGQKPRAIILTSGNHERGASQISKALGIPVWAHPDAAPEQGITIDEPLREGILKSTGLEVIELPGFGPGEIALYSPANEGTLIIGDAIINSGTYGFIPLPAKYCMRPELTVSSLEKLLQFSFEVMTFAHGLPIVSNARQRLENLLKK